MNRVYYISCQAPNGDKMWNQKSFEGTRKQLHDSWRKGHFSVYRQFCIDNPGTKITLNGNKINWSLGK